MRTAGGQFRKMVGADIGVGGVCPACNHLLLRHYNGDSHIRPLDPMKWRYRCFTCEPLTEAEQAQQE